MNIHFKILIGLIIIIVILILLAGTVYGAASYFNDYSTDSSIIVDNDNLAPYVDFSFTKKQKVDLNIVLRNTVYSPATINSKFTSIVKPILDDRGIVARLTVISSTNELNVNIPSCTWNDGAVRYYVEMNNSSVPELLDSSKLTMVLSSLSNNSVSFVGMGQSSNQTLFENLIASNKGNGTYIDNSVIDTALTKLANYIAGNISTDLYFNVDKASVTMDALKTKIESIVKPKLIANNISPNIMINDGTATTLKGSKLLCISNTQCLALKPDGTLWQIILGNPCTVTRVQADLPQIVDIAGCGNIFFALGKDGYVYAWGQSGYLGVGVSSGTTTIPVKVLGGQTGDTYLSNVKAITNASDNIIALKSDGTVVHWGSTLWYDATPTLLTPVYVLNSSGTGPINNIVQVAAGAGQVLLLDSASNLYTFGSDPRLTGFGVEVINPKLLDTNVKRIAAYSSVSAYQKNNLSLWYFGGSYDDVYYNNAVIPPTVVDGGVPFPDYESLLCTGEGAYGLINNNLRRFFHDSYNEWPGPLCYCPYGMAASDIAYAFPLGYKNAVYIRTDGSVVFDAYRTQNSYSNLISWGYKLTVDEYMDTYCNYNMPWYHPIPGGETGDTYFTMMYKYELALSDVLSKAAFRDTSDNYFIDLTNNSQEELTDSNKLNNDANALKSCNSRFVGLGTPANKTQFENLILANDNKGVYFDNTNIDAALNNLADYIVNNAMRPPALISDYLLVNEEVDTPTVFYSDIESDPYDSKWVYLHDAKNFLSNSGVKVPFDNSNGSFSLSGKALSAPVTSFVDIDANGSEIGKVGGYKVTFQAKDKPKGNDLNFTNYNRDSNIVTKYLNLHRKPVANFTAVVTVSGINFKVDLNDNNLSYDLDHTSRSDKGIVNRIWGYATITTNSGITWNYTKTTDKQITFKVPQGQRYLFSLQVQDMDGTYGYGAWSDPVVVAIPDKPVACFIPSPNPLPVDNTLTITDTSYATFPDYTITQRLWNITKVGSSAFSYVDQPLCKLNYLDSGVGEYKITLRVKDTGGNWSDPYTQSLLVVDNVAPTINAFPASRTWANTDANVNLSAHDTGGSGLKRIDYIWTKEPADTSAYSSVNISNSPVRFDYNIAVSQSINGKWYLCARALDHSDNYSNNGGFSIFGTYNIDKIAPNISSTIAPGTYQESVTASINATDAGGSGIKTIQYQWTNSTGKPASGWSSINIPAPENSSVSTSSTNNAEGTWYLHMQTIDFAGNISYQYSGPFIIQYLNITDVKIEGYWNHWRGQVDMFGKQLTNEPYRFLSYEKVRVTVNTIGNPNKIEVTFSPELQSMSFIDIYGHAYNYADKIGYTVNFPHQISVTGNQSVWEYILPLAPSTKDWNDARVAPSYWMQVKAYKGATVATYDITGIELTGNVYDLTYIQPKY